MGSSSSDTASKTQTSVGVRSDSLPFLNGDPDQVTMSGFSAGCFMAHQMSIIYPDEVNGAVLTCCWSYGDKNTFDGVDTTAADLGAASISLIDTNENAGSIGSTSDIAA